MAEEKASWSGLTDDEAKEFHEVYMSGFVLFTGIAVVAHFLVWLWRPWIPGPDGYAALDGVKDMAISAVSMIG